MLDWLTVPLAMKLVGVVLLTAFMPIAAYTFFRFRLTHKRQEFERLIDTLGLRPSSETAAEAAANAGLAPFDDEYTRRDYVLPVGFATVLVALGGTSLLLGTEIELARIPNLVLGGTVFPLAAEMESSGLLAAGSKSAVYQQHSLLAMTMGFMGALIWSMQNAVRRLITVDLSPGAFYGMAIRLLFAAFIALILHHFLQTVPDISLADLTGAGAATAGAGGPPVNLAEPKLIPVISFLVGIFPQRAINWLAQKIAVVRSDETKRAHELPLIMIEGINGFHRFRLEEISIDNAQNLAAANFIELVLRTPFNPRMLIDWMAQAQLYTLFKEDIRALRKAGVRSVLDFIALADSDTTNLDRIASQSGLPRERLEIAYSTLQTSEAVSALRAIAGRMRGAYGIA